MRLKIVILALAVALAALPSLAHGQGGSPGSQTSGSNTADLSHRIDALKKELASEREQLEKAQTARTTAQSEEEQRSKLQSQLQSLQTQYNRLSNRQKEQASGDSPEPSRLNLAEGDPGGAPLDSVRQQAASAAEQLRVLLQELPADGRAARAREVQAQLEDPKGSDAALVDLIELLEESVAASSAVGIERVELWTATGRQEAVDLLRVGNIGYAYRTVKDQRLGLSVRSARDARGFRWTEELDQSTRTAILTAFSDVNAGRTPIRVPLDVTGQLQQANVGDQRSLIAAAKSGGLVMIPLLGVALLALLLILERALVLFGANRTPEELGRRVLEASQQQKYEEARGLCVDVKGTVARTLEAVLARRSRGRSAMEDGVQAQLLAEMPKLQRFIGGIAVLAAVAPLLGLLGTVTGIIRTFAVIKSFGNANPGLMAGGIAEALTTTAAGLIIAIPLLLAHSLLKGRAESIVSDAERLSAELLGTFDYPDGRSTS